MKYLKLKFLLMFFALAMAIPPAWAETSTMEFTKKCGGSGTADDGAVWTVTSDGTESDFDDVRGIHYGTKNAAVTYLQLSTSDIEGTITKVEVTACDATSSGDLTVTVGASDFYYGEDTYVTLPAASNTYTFTGSGNGEIVVRIDRGSSMKKAIYLLKIVVTYQTGNPNAPTLTAVPTSLTNINDLGGSFTVNGSNLGTDNVGVTTNNGFSTTTNDKSWGFENGSALVNGTITGGEVTVTYQGRDLSARGTVILDNNDLDPALEVPVSYRSDVYIFNDNGNGSWNFTTGNTKMDYANDKYSTTITTNNDNTCILFGRKTGENYRWENDWTDGVHNRLFFGVNSNGDWVYGTNTSGSLEISPSDGRNKYSPIKFPTAGTYTITIDPEAKTFSITSTNVANIAEAQEFDGRFNFTGNAVVTYQNGENLWIRDASKSGLIVGSVDDFTNGDILKSGWMANNRVQYNVPQFINPTGVELDYHGDYAAPEVLNEITTDDVNKYASMSGVTVTAVSGKKYTVTINGVGPYYLYDQFGIVTTNKPIENGHTYNVVGVVTIYSGDPELYLTEFEEVKELIVTLTSDTKTAEIGETIPVTVTVENYEGDYTVTYKFGENGTETTLTGSTINVTSETAGQVDLIVNVTNGENHATASETYTFTAPLTGNNVFTKVKSADQLVANKRYIIVYDNKAMGTSVITGSSNGQWLAAVDVITASGDNVQVGDDVAIMTLGGTSGQYTLALGDKYLHAVNNTTLGFTGEATNWAISNYNGTLNGYRVKHADNSRAVRYSTSSKDRFGNYALSDNNSDYGWIYVEKASTPQPELAVTLPDAPTQNYKVGQEVKVKATVENGSDNTVLTYKVGDETLTPDNEGNVTLPNKKSGEVVLTVTAVDGDKEATDTKTYVFDKADALTITLTPATGTYYVGDEQNVTVTVEDAIDANPTITYKFGEEGTVQNYNAETGILLPTSEAGTINLTVMVDDGGYEHTGATTATATYTVNHKALTITLTPESGNYTVGQENPKVKVEITNVVGELQSDYALTYKVGEEVKNATVNGPDAEGYITLPNDKAVTYTLTVTALDDREDGDLVEKTGTYAFTAAPAITFDLDIVHQPEGETYHVGDVVKVKATNIQNVIILNDDDMSDVTYMIGETPLTPGDDGYVTIPSDEVDEVTLTVTVEDLYEHAADATQEVTFNFVAADAINITLTADPEAATYTVGDVVNVKVATTGTIGNDVLITYTTDFESKAESTYDSEKGIDITSDKAGDVTLTVNVYDGYAHEGADENGITTKTADYTFVKAPAINITFDPASGTEFTVGQEAKVKVTIAGAADDYEAEYKIGDNVVEPVDGYIVLPNTATDDVTLTVSVYDGIDRIGADESGFTTATATYTFSPMPVVAAPTFSLVAGTYGKAQQLTISAESGASILYSTDGSEPTTPYNGAIDLGQGTTTVKAVATKDGFAKSPVVTATYIIDIPEELPTITPFKGYYQIKNNENNMYANIAGRKTLNFADAENAKKMAGTVIWLETNDKGQVQSLRSQAADLQGYANRAMRYVPQMVDIVVNKINEMEGIENATGPGSVLGETGLDSIMAKFNKCFDYHLYVEQAQGGWRLYGKTPNMQHVVDFYRDHKDQVEAKLPKLEKFINDALHKLINKIGGSTVFTDFSLRQIWENMGGNLPEPVVGDDAAIMDFYRAVLNNKNYVWDFAYQTAQIYWGNVKSHPRYEELKAQLGEYADYIDEFVTQVRPDFKYYVIQRGDEPDYISEGNGEIISNDPRTLWTLEPRTDFTVNIAGEQFGCPYAGGVGGYATTNYTDFAYTVPEGVTAYKVASVENGVANLQALSGVIPAQTPVLLMAKTAGDYVLKLSTEAGTKVTGNLLVGVDSLITRFQLKTPMVESLFSLAKGVLGEQLYNQYVAQYEYLQLLYAGTVNNKYFWGLTRDDVMKCLNANGDDCVVRDLSGSKFIDNRQVKTNKAFLVSETDQTITISTLRGDVNHDGYVNIDDVTALIDYLLEVDGRACPYCANVNCDSTVNIVDVTYLIDILLGNISPYAEGGNGN